MKKIIMEEKIRNLEWQLKSLKISTTEYGSTVPIIDVVRMLLDYLNLEITRYVDYPKLIKKKK